uniref:Uncharacterized protein n=1 Tax=Utricularia reniformis TaxID=192314 RepID=A0A1Y0AZF8_9LAMI|nr:hypothetical protein AEK19_MT0245 [Utricularia reniformis]ART30523.1 hypothetical protein AEK19_MT0245 [Utricularia reniformis]
MTSTSNQQSVSVPIGSLVSVAFSSIAPLIRILFLDLLLPSLSSNHACLLIALFD